MDAFAFARWTGARAFVSADAMSTSSTLRARVRALVRLVHPDVLMSTHPALARANEDALARLQGTLDGGAGRRGRRARGWSDWCFTCETMRGRVGRERCDLRFERRVGIVET